MSSFWPYSGVKMRHIWHILGPITSLRNKSGNKLRVGGISDDNYDGAPHKVPDDDEES